MLVVEISFITENVYIHLTYVFSIDPNSQEDDGLTAADVCLFSLVLKILFSKQHPEFDYIFLSKLN
jgi:hypothetical protein